MNSILAALDRMSELTVVVVGDFFVDEYVHSEMFEISKEGPIPVLRFESRDRKAGAAGNLASSIRNLGANVRAVGVIGDDANGRALTAELDEKGIDTRGLIVDPRRPTLTYTKFRARVPNAPSQEIFRLDVLPTEMLSPELEERILAEVRRASRGADGIIVLDQVSHLITERLLDELPGIARENGALLHGSSREAIGEFRGFDLIIPNEVEAAGALGVSPRSPPSVLGHGLRDLGEHAQILLTLGPEGMATFPSRGPEELLPTVADAVVDVTGAGDAVASTALLLNVLGLPLGDVARAASHAAAIAIAHVGTHHVTQEELAARVQART